MMDLTHDDGVVNEDYANVLLDANAPSAIVAAMKKYPDDVRMQSGGSEALGNLVFSFDGASKLVDAGGIPVILKAMKDHADCVHVQTHVCFCLANIVVQYPNCIGIMLNHGGIEAVFSAIQKFSGDSDLLKEACYCLLNLVENDEEASERIKQDRGVLILAQVEFDSREDKKNSEINRMVRMVLHLVFENSFAPANVQNSNCPSPYY
jgi:hypothetical protein